MRRVAAIVLGIVIAAWSGRAAAADIPSRMPPDRDYTMAYVIDRAKIIDTVNSIGTFADLGQWDRVKEAFADEVILDYTSYAAAVAGGDGGSPATLTPDQIVAAWKTVLPGYERTQHLITNHLVTIDGDKAHCLSQVFASHYLPNTQGEDYWIVVGHYDHELVRTENGWKVTLMRLNYGFQLGNLKLSDLAVESFKTRRQ